MNSNCVSPQIQDRILIQTYRINQLRIQINLVPILLGTLSDTITDCDRILITKFEFDFDRSLRKSNLKSQYFFLLGSWAKSRSNPARILFCGFKKISEQELEPILKRILFHLEKSLLTGIIKILNRILN